jgi:hypothetical protein
MPFPPPEKEAVFLVDLGGTESSSLGVLDPLDAGGEMRVSYWHIRPSLIHRQPHPVTRIQN